MLSNSEKLIAVIGATGQQGGAVVRALQAGSLFKVRALSRNPDKHRELAAEEVHTYLGSDSYGRIALANKIAGEQPTKFSTWARVNFPT
jgi:nucleoside-diphosphate-sugar epimerase